MNEIERKEQVLKEIDFTTTLHNIPLSRYVSTKDIWNTDTSLLTKHIAKKQNGCAWFKAYLWPYYPLKLEKYLTMRRIFSMRWDLCRFIFCSLSYKLFFQKHRGGGDKWTIWFFRDVSSILLWTASSDRFVWKWKMISVTSL